MRIKLKFENIVWDKKKKINKSRIEENFVFTSFFFFDYQFYKTQTNIIKLLEQCYTQLPRSQYADLGLSTKSTFALKQ